MEALLKLPHVQVILSDNEKTICSVHIYIERTERIDSGSMMFHMPRYISIGQTVIFTKKEISGFQGGALFFVVDTEDEAVDICNNIKDHLLSEKEKRGFIILEQPQ